MYRMADRILDGQLDETLSSYAEQGLSPGRMALRLAADYQVEVSGQTIKKWVAALPHPTPSRPAQTAQTTRSAQTAQTTRRTQTRGAHVAVAS